jgi:hypothetical protein
MELVNNPLIWAAVAVVVIGRQFVPRAIRPAALVVLPLVLGAVGLQAVVEAPPQNLLAFAIFAVDAVAGVGLGLARGASVRVWRTADGVWMRQGTPLTLGLWVASIAIRVGLAAIDRTAVPLNEITFFLALTFAAQNLVLWLRTGGVASLLSQTR